MLAKDKFKEGFIMLKRPFLFSGMKNPIQKMTIVYAYCDEPEIKFELNALAKKEIDDLDNNDNFGDTYFGKSIEEVKEHKLMELYKHIDNNPQKYKNKIYIGEIVQSTIETQICKFYPDEYSILSLERLYELLENDGYHVVIENLQVLNFKSFKDRCHYLQQRGINKDTAIKWTSMSFKDTCYYKPYYELLKMYARDNEIYPDEFYLEKEKILIEQ